MRVIRQSVVDLYDMLAEETEDPDLTHYQAFSRFDCAGTTES